MFHRHSNRKFIKRHPSPRQIRFEISYAFQISIPIQDPHFRDTQVQETIPYKLFTFASFLNKCSSTYGQAKGPLHRQHRPVCPPLSPVAATNSPVSAQAEWDALNDVADPIVVKSTNRADFFTEAKSGAFEGVVAAYRSFTSISITGMIDAELLALMPSTFKFLCQNGAGYDPINVHDCAAAGVRVCNVPEIADDSTADTCLFLILGALRMFNPVMGALREGTFKGPNPIIGHDPRGKVLGILGMGGIGRNVMKKAETFGMKVQYYNRKELSKELSGGAKYVSFDELLATSDVLSLNLPLSVSNLSLFFYLSLS